MITMKQTRILCPIHGIRFWEVYHNGKKENPVCEKCNNTRWKYFIQHASKLTPVRNE